MDWWTELRLATEVFLQEHGLFAAFVILLVEEAGVPIPIPGDFLMLAMGTQAEDLVSLLQAILVMQAATMIGATILYAVARLGGRNLVYRYGRFIRLSPERLDQAEQWLLKHGTRAVFLGRLVPGLRIVTAVACGVFRVPLWIYLPAMSIGALVYLTVYAFLGYFFGRPVLFFLERLHLPMGLLGSLIPVVVVVVWVLRARRSLEGANLARQGWELDHEHRIAAGSAAGLLATIASTLFMNVVINLAGNIAFQAPGTIIEQTAARLAMAGARDLAPVALFIAIPVFVLVGMLWGALYASLEEHLHRLSDWQSGVIFSLFPLTISLLVVMPFLGAGALGVDIAGPVVAVGELIRHFAFGAVLGLAYPVLLARRKARQLSAAKTDPGEAATEARAGAESVSTAASLQPSTAQD